MAQFKAFAPNVLVNGQTVLSVVNAIPVGKDTRLEILARHGIKDLRPEEWYSQTDWLSAFQEIATSLGSNTLFAIGKAIPEHAKFPPEINNLEKALSAIDVAYKMNHKGGDIGSYKLISFDERSKKAVMECNNPYPSEFDRGIISTMLRRFRPKDSFSYDVALDLNKPTRLNGQDSCTFAITW